MKNYIVHMSDDTYAKYRNVVDVNLTDKSFGMHFDTGVFTVINLDKIKAIYAVDVLYETSPAASEPTAFFSDINPEDCEIEPDGY